MASRAKAAKGLAWLVGGRVGSAGLSILSTAVLARLLTPADFGVIAAAMVVLALANVIFDGAFGVNLLRKKELQPKDVRTTLTVGLLVGVVLAAAVVLVAPAIERFFGFPGLAAILAACSVIIPVKAVFAIATATLQRDGKFRFIALASFLGQFVGYILIGIPLSFAGAGIWSLVAAMTVGGFVEAIATAVAARLSFRPSLDLYVLRDIRETSLFSVANLMNWVANTSTNTIVGAGMGAVGLGLYSRGWKLLDLVVGATATPLSRVLLPAFAGLRGDESRLCSAFLSAIALVVPLYSVAAAVLTLQAPLIVDLALGHQWTDTVPVAQILFAALTARCAFKVSENFAIAVGQSSSAAIRQALYAVLMIGGALIGVRHGIVGVAIGASVSITLFYVASMSFAIRVGRIPVVGVLAVHLKAAILAAAVAGTDGAALWLLQDTPLLLQHTVAGSSAVLVATILLAMRPGFWLGHANARAVIAKLRPLGDKLGLRSQLAPLSD